MYRPNASPNCRKLIKWKVDETFTYLRTHQHASFDDYLERLGHLKRFCHKELRVVANDSIDSICRTLYEKSCEAVKDIHEKHMNILKTNGVNRLFTNIEYFKILYIFIFQHHSHLQFLNEKRFIAIQLFCQFLVQGCLT